MIVLNFPIMTMSAVQSSGDVPPDDTQNTDSEQANASVSSYPIQVIYCKGYVFLLQKEKLLFCIAKKRKNLLLQSFVVILYSID